MISMKKYVAGVRRRVEAEGLWSSFVSGDHLGVVYPS